MPRVDRKPIWFSADELEWLIAMTELLGDPFGLKAPLHETFIALAAKRPLTQPIRPLPESIADKEAYKEARRKLKQLNTEQLNHFLEVLDARET